MSKAAVESFLACCKEHNFFWTGSEEEWQRVLRMIEDAPEDSAKTNASSQTLLGTPFQVNNQVS